MQMLPEGASAPDVTWKDQQLINTFSRLSARLDRLSELQTERKQSKEDLDDVSMELELADDDDEFQYHLGDAFVWLPLDQVQQRLESDKSNIDAQIDKGNDEIAAINKDLDSLRVQLYHKFGSAINLDK